MIRILIVDDEPAIREVLAVSLRDEGYDVRAVGNGEQALSLLSSWQPAVVLLDIWMPGSLDGIEVLKKGRSPHSLTEFIMMSGHGTIETAVKATKLGAWDFIEKPLSIDKISIVIGNVVAYQAERQDKITLLARLRKNIALVGGSESMQTLKQMVARLAADRTWVLLSGESGVGKELVAQNIHYLSSRVTQPFVTVNLSGISPSLQESELFGHEAGTFSGGDRSRKGKLELVQEGTLFLRDLQALAPATQERLFDFLLKGSFTRLGGSTPINSGARVIGSTTADLEDLVREGAFHKELFHRLSATRLTVPPLREHPEDIPLLTEHFSTGLGRDGGYQAKTFTDEALGAMQTHGWPGNVRELRNFIERLYILTPRPKINVSDLHLAGLKKRRQRSKSTGVELS